MTRVLGIDPGLKGGLALFVDGNLQQVHHMPTMPVTKTKNRLDIWGLQSIMGPPDVIVVERSQSFPVMGKVQNFSLGYQFGVIVGIVSGLSWPPYKKAGRSLVLVRPQEWKKSVLIGYNRKDKSASIDYCLKRFPFFGKLTDGEADAVCIGLYGLDFYGHEKTGSVGKDLSRFRPRS